MKNNTGCKIIAHRGLSSLERENSCAAFIAAAVNDYYGIETDVHATADGMFVICHDDNILRVTGVDLVIEESKFEQIIKQPLLDVDGKTQRSDLVIPVPEDYFSICKKYGKFAIFEFKNKLSEKNIDDLVALIKKMGMYKHTVFISFEKDNLIYLRKKHDDATIQYLTGEATVETLEFIKKYGFGLDIYYRALNKECVDAVHSFGLEVNCWTCDDKEDAKKLIQMGVDYITTNVLL